MSNSTPSLLALLGLVAYAGYRNRDRISDMLQDARQGRPDDDRITSLDGGFFSQIGRLFHPSTTGPTLSGGLDDLARRLRRAGHAAAIDSWVAPGPNLPLEDRDLEAALGDEMLAELGRKTGLQRAELVRRLNLALPDVVNQFTPEGRLPSETEARVLA